MKNLIFILMLLANSSLCFSMSPLNPSYTKPPSPTEPVSIIKKDVNNLRKRALSNATRQANFIKIEQKETLELEEKVKTLIMNRYEGLDTLSNDEQQTLMQDYQRKKELSEDLSYTREVFFEKLAEHVTAKKIVQVFKDLPYWPEYNSTEHQKATAMKELSQLPEEPVYENNDQSTSTLFEQENARPVLSRAELYSLFTATDTPEL